VEDFPLWMKILIWLVVGGTVIYAVGAMLYTGFGGWLDDLLRRALGKIRRNRV